MANQFRFLHDGLPVQPLPIDLEGAIVPHHEVAGAKAGEVVEEVRALAQFHIDLRQRGFDDRACPRDLAPVHRNTQRRMGAAPTPESDQEEWPALLPELAEIP